MKSWIAPLGALIVFASAELGVSFAQHEDDMAMMKKMMMNRPKALKQADMTVQTEKKKLMQAGKYGCCLKHGCDQCVLKMGGCPCGMNAANGKPVCHECKGGWEAGDGAIAGKKAADIKVMPRMEMKMGDAGEGKDAVKIVDVWRCPVTGEAVHEGSDAGNPVVVGSYRVHFCCPGCPSNFASLTDEQKKQKAEVAAKKDGKA